MPVGTTMHVLVVEDEEPVRTIIVRNLERRGHRVSEARTVAWAVDSCQADPPDVMVLDINLPDGSGWDVLRGLAARGLARPPVVAVSAGETAEKRLAEFAPVTYLPKPFVIEALLRAIDRTANRGARYEPVDHPSV